MPAWKDYQEEAAQFYRSLGLIATTDERIEGVRGTHDIDVAVRGRHGGIDFLWIVECKRWARPIPKEKVAALSSVVADIGASRGILLSEAGFQAGALRMAERSNVTLTSLKELGENAEPEVLAYSVATLRDRLRAARTELNALLRPVHSRRGKALITTFHVPKAWGDRTPAIILGRVVLLEHALEEAECGRWPILMPSHSSSPGNLDASFQAHTPADLVNKIEYELGEIEMDLRRGEVE
ncbi:restriction endonuclease [Rhodococcus sp. YH1]|uniref:restriction endonuclease n=1 Tax=Rhodococcus sp. YH1 TaxID=89066 RepID=UPI00138727FF|nr:hypothetical protein [Rhodococcus sp. YH1]